MDDASLESLSAFFEWCEQGEKCNLRRHLRYLESNDIPNSEIPNHSDIESIKLAIRSMHAIRAIIRGIYTGKCKADENGISPFELILNAWPGSCHWIHFLHTHCISKACYGETLMSISLRTIPLFLQFFALEDALRSAVIETQGVIVMLTQYWMKEKSFVQHSELEWDKLHYTNTLASLLRYDQAEDTLLLTTIFQSVDGGACQIARVATEHLTFHLAENDNNLNTGLISFYVYCAYVLLDTNDPAPQKRTAYLVMIPAVTALLCRIPSPEVINTPITSPMDSCLMMCCSILLRVAHLSDGPSWVCQALDEGFLLGLLRSEPWALRTCSSELISTMSKKLFDLLHQYLVYRSVLRTIANSMKMIRDDHRAGDGLFPVREGWLSLRNAASERLALRDLFDNGIDSGYSGCDNVQVSWCKIASALCSPHIQCPRGSKACKFWRCSGCLGARYCSMRCHRLCWQSHRITCKAWQQRLHGPCSKLLASVDES